MVIARSPAQAELALRAAGHDPSQIVTSDDPSVLSQAISDGRVTVSTDPRVLIEVPDVEVVVEATGDVSYGALVSLSAIGGGKHLVSLNYETDATVGPLLAAIARSRGVVYTGSDGDQPGVMMRLYDYVRGIGLDVVAAVNCKGFLDRHATPETIAPWAESQGTSPKMTTAFTDGTKMNVENASVANATGLTPEKRGMHGVETTLSHALEDFKVVLNETGVVEYTLGGDFGSGVFIIASGADPELAAPYLSYLKMGLGPWYLFFRPWHLVQFETPLSIAEAALDGMATIAPGDRLVAQVVAMAKRDLSAGHAIDGIGGFDVYGEIDTADNAAGLLPIGLADQCVATRAVQSDRPIALDAVELSHSPLVRLWEAQHRLSATPSHEQQGYDPRVLIRMWDGEEG
jgi:predicted homoserine dehydrogenase-like protein